MWDDSSYAQTLPAAARHAVDQLFGDVSSIMDAFGADIPVEFR